jgi:RNA polymerase sigma-70 factor (ECF subfamily)
MTADEPDRTRASLLLRIRMEPNNGQVWEDFVRVYGPKIRSWCTKWQISEPDADDISQLVLVKLVEKLPEFEYDSGQSFRGWLKVMVHNTWIDLTRKNKQDRSSGDTAIGRLLNEVEAREDLVQRLQREYDHELYLLALERTRLRVEPQTWKAFELTAIEGLKGKEASQRIPMQVAQVYVAKRRVQQLIREEIEKLEK